MPEPVLEIKGLRLDFSTFAGDVKALDGVDLVVYENETLGLVGESGCGKSVTAMSVLRLLPTPPAKYREGQIFYHGSGKQETIDLLELEPRDLGRVRGNEIAMIFQEPMTSLNPVMRVGDQITECILQHDPLGHPIGRVMRWLELRDLRVTRALRERRARAERRAGEMLAAVGIADPESMLARYPHELSGGMRQRVMIAMALATNPHLLIADEPTTALDVTIQAQIMELMKDLKKRMGASILLITHHLGVVAEMCDRVAVMYAGQVIEVATTREVFKDPRHPYTLALLKSIPDARGGGNMDLPTITGSVPNLLRPPSGCRFHPRCPFAFAKCSEERPPFIEVGKGHQVACHLWSTPGKEMPEEFRHVPVTEPGAAHPAEAAPASTARAKGVRA